MPHHHELTMSDQTAPPPQIKITWLIGTVVAFAIFVAIGGYSARMTQTYTSYDDDRAAQRYATLAQVRADENKLIYPVDADKKPTAEWIDQDKGVIRIPIDEAMALEIDTLKAQQPAIGCEIPGAVPAPPPPAPASTNAAPVAPVPPAAAGKPGAKPADAKAKGTGKTPAAGPAAATAKPKT
jgi:hypothetical protein